MIFSTDVVAKLASRGERCKRENELRCDPLERGSLNELLLVSMVLCCCQQKSASCVFCFRIRANLCRHM